MAIAISSTEITLLLFSSNTGLFKSNNKIGLGSGNKDVQPKDHDSITQGVSIVNMKDSNGTNDVGTWA